MIQFSRLLLVCSAVPAIVLLTPSIAEASWLPGWGSQDGTPGTDVSWCHGTDNTLHVGDFDGNGFSDLLCHTGSSASPAGRRQIDFAYSTTRGLWGTNWDSNTDGGAVDNWCTAAGQQIFVGDFNGDGRSDLMCRVAAGSTNPGRKEIDFADSSGHFDGTDWDSLSQPSAAQNWCTNSGEQVHVGDFNDDGKDDLLCFVRPTYTNAGRKRIDYAGATGTFFGTDYNTASHPEVDQDWCSDPGEKLYVGDFNGDGNDDLLCHGGGYGYTNGGRRKVDFYGSVSEPFAGSDFDSDDWVGQGAWASWCDQLGDELHIGRFDTNLKDDLVCVNWHSNNDFSLRVDHANSAGTFFKTDGPLHEESWCKSSVKNRNFHMGDFDGDGGSDVLCHDPTYGYRSIRYVSSAGDFYSVCSDNSFAGDGTLPALPIHFSVVSDPSATSDRTASMPTATSTHTHPIDGTDIYQSTNPRLYFDAEVELINKYTYAAPGPAPGNPMCYNSDCLAYEYQSHSLFSDLTGVTDTRCQEVLKFATPPDERYGATCVSRDNINPLLCFPFLATTAAMTLAQSSINGRGHSRATSSNAATGEFTTPTHLM